MNTTRQENYGWTLAACGIFIAVFSHSIVYSGLQPALGIDALIGADSFLHPSDGRVGYNPYNPTAALFRLVTLTALFGLLVATAGAVLIFTVRPDLRLFVRRIADTTPFTRTALFANVHAAAPMIYMISMGIAQRAGWISVPPLFGVGFLLWVLSVLTWPLWYAVVPRANRRQGFSPVIPLVVGTILWGLSAVPAVGLFLMLFLWRGC